MNIPLTKPSLDDNELAAVRGVLESGWLTQGPRVEDFERALAGFSGARHALATTSCTTALFLALRLNGIRSGDEVIMPSYTCPATANAVCHTGAVPIFVDIDPQTFNIDCNAVRASITEKTKAILAVHQYGLPADMDRIKEIGAEKGLLVIEDAGVAIGATYKGKHVGALGNITCFSFHGRKVITTGEGGMLTTEDSSFYERALIARSHGASISDTARHQAMGTLVQSYDQLGYNFRMTDIQAAIGTEQMKKLPAFIARRRQIADEYASRFQDIPEVVPPFVPDYAEHSYQTYAIQIRKNGFDVVKFLGQMAARGVSCRHTLSCHTEPFFKGYCGKYRLPVTEQAMQRTVCLPLFPSMTEAEIDHVVKSLKEVLSQS